VYQPACPNGWNPKRPAYGRVWIDQPGNPERARRTVSLGICRTKTVARQKLGEWITREGINTAECFHQNTAPVLTFRQQSDIWIASVRNRVKPATLKGWRQSLNKWLVPAIGDMPLADVRNAALKLVVDRMASLSAQSIITHTKVLKLVVASAVNAEGEQLHKRLWNNQFAGIPRLNPTTQHRPTFKATEVESFIARVGERYRVAVALLAVTGMRAGELLAVKVEDLTPDCHVLTVRRSIWGGKEQDPKTLNAFRLIDIPEEFAAILRGYVAGRSGYLFKTASGKPWGQRNFLRALHIAGAQAGFHAFRRFRTVTSRRAGVPEPQIKAWMGWSKESMADFYGDDLQKEEQWRERWVDVAGVGFSLIGLQRVTKVVSIQSSEAA
jgi:integrase